MTERTHYSIKDFCAAYGLGRTTVWRLIKSGRIPTMRFGRRVLIPINSPTYKQSGDIGEQSETSGNKHRRQRPTKSRRDAHFETYRNV